ncbi:PIN domain-containing protein [Micromonospora parva]|uniref:PIN domain-containing protein n=1 Tax=Micromonospora parva TaxID=1464048 RepID=UPI0033E04252
MPSFSTNFSGHLVPDSAMIAHAMKNGLIVLDTNVLLGAYRFASKAREELLSALERVRDRLWIPHQVAYEFHKNRFGVIADHDAAYKTLLEMLRERRKAIESELEAKIRELSNRVALTEKERDRLLSMARQGYSPLEKAIEGLHKSHGLVELTGRDPVLERLEKIFEGRVGEPYDSEQLSTARSEAERRVSEGAPPGYKDAGKSDSTGDYLVWAQTLDEVKQRKPESLVFVTADTKDDWYLRVKGKTIIGRPELADECRELTGARLITMPTLSFLRNAHEHLNADVSAETLQQAAKVSAHSNQMEHKRRLERVLDKLDRDRAILRVRAKDVELSLRRSQDRVALAHSKLRDVGSVENVDHQDEDYKSLVAVFEEAQDRMTELVSMRDAVRQESQILELRIARVRQDLERFGNRGHKIPSVQAVAEDSEV